jgi:hypothetical protein
MVLANYKHFIEVFSNLVAKDSIELVLYLGWTLEGLLMT